jgi:drug/metabolite transporter (DMT)-like permease
VLVAWLTEPFPVYLSPAIWGAILFTALPATALALLLQVVAQQWTPPHQAALLLTLEPVFATLIAFLFLGERLSGRELAGCGLILAAMLVAEVPPFFHVRHSLPSRPAGE